MQSEKTASSDIPEPPANPPLAASSDLPPHLHSDSPAVVSLDTPPSPPVDPPPGRTLRSPPAMSLDDPARPASDPPPGPPSSSPSAMSLDPPEAPSESPPESHADRSAVPPPPPLQPPPLAATAKLVLPPQSWSASAAASAAVDKIQPPKPATLQRPLPVSSLPMPSTAKPAPPVALLQVDLAHQVSTTDAWQILQAVMHGLPYDAGRPILPSSRIESKQCSERCFQVIMHRRQLALLGLQHVTAVI